MSQPIQTIVVSPGGFGVNHDYSISGVLSTSTLAIIVDELTDITSVTLLGGSGTLGLDNSVTSSPGGRRWELYSLTAVGSGVTGIRVTTSGSHTDPTAVICEMPGSMVFDDADYFPEDFTDIVAIPLTTTGTDDVIFAKLGSLGDTLTDNSGFSHTAETSSNMAQYNSTELGAPGTETPGGTFSGSNSRFGYAAAYKATAGSPPVLMGQACL